MDDKNAPALRRSLFLHGLEVQCAIGIHPGEREAKQRMIFDIELRLRPDTEPQADDIAATLDTDTIRAAVHAAAAARHYDLQETLARQIFDTLRAMPHVIGVAVATCKPDAYPDCKGGVGYRLCDIGDSAD